MTIISPEKLSCLHRTMTLLLQTFLFKNFRYKASDLIDMYHLQISSHMKIWLPRVNTPTAEDSGQGPGSRQDRRGDSSQEKERALASLGRGQ